MECSATLNYVKRLNLTEPSAVFPYEINLPYVLVSDNAFSLSETSMKPYGHGNVTPEQELFNRKLCSARVKVENAFGIISARFRILLGTINLNPDKAAIVVLACCYHHNYLRRNREDAYTNVTSSIEPNKESFISMPSTHARNEPKSHTTVSNILPT